MSNANVKIKLLNSDAQVPEYGRAGDAGLDLFSCMGGRINPGQRLKISLGFAVELPSGTVALIWDRSGMAAKHGIHSIAGVIDSNYRGEVSVVLYNTTDQVYDIKKGDRVAQMVIQKYEIVKFELVDELADSERGDGAWLSSGK